jgi:HAD superfamily hydrolase (TIGR01509 family)
MIQGAIFDFDGTLFDSMFIWDTIGNDYLHSIGYEPKEDLSEVFKSMSLVQAACWYQKEYGVTLSVKEIMDGVNHMIEHYYRNVIQPKEGVPAFLQKLSDKGIRMIIATATDRTLIEAALKKYGLAHYFADILTCTAVGSGKDEPEIYRQAAKKLGTAKKDTLVFEDALYAVQTAAKDGFPVAAVWDASEKETDKVKKLAAYYLPDYLDFDTFWKQTSLQK